MLFFSHTLYEMILYLVQNMTKNLCTKNPLVIFSFFNKNSPLVEYVPIDRKISWRGGRPGGGGRQGDSMLKQKDFGYHFYVSYYTILKDVLVKRFNQMNHSNSHSISKGTVFIRSYNYIFNNFFYLAISYIILTSYCQSLVKFMREATNGKDYTKWSSNKP